MWHIQRINNEIALFDGKKKVAILVCKDAAEAAARLLVCLNHCKAIKTEELITPPTCGKCEQ